jgi:hypothetical protein
VVAASAPGYKPLEKKVRAIAGAPDIVELELQPLPATVEIDTEAGAAISVDGRRVGVAPLAAFDVPAGRHLVTVTARGREPAGKEVDVTRAERAHIAIPLAMTTRRRAVPWVAGTAIALGVVSLTTLGGALYWNHEARDLRDQIDRGGVTDPNALANYSDAHTRRDVARAASITSGGLAVGVGLAAAWLYYFDRPEAEGVRVAPIAGPGNAGAMLFGRF